ncbi:hydrolase [Deltaproteobacteria bacterium]|nr:hydrolase [Deltaproteobacteria bacterium]
MNLPLVCFDIDGTILRTRGAGREALDEAFLALYGWNHATEGVNVAGATDDVICRDVAARFGEAWLPSATPQLVDRYLVGLRHRVEEPGRAELLPGVSALLDALAGRAHVALLTGNWQIGADVKLRAVEVERRFDWGVYSEDAFDRDGLVPAARLRAASRGLGVGEVVVLGDTVSDVKCARAGGARVVVVETGFSTPEALANARPDLQVANLSEGLAWILALIQA